MARRKKSEGTPRAKAVLIPQQRYASSRNWCEQCNRLVPGIPAQQASDLGTSILKSGRTIMPGNLHLIGLRDGSIRVCLRSFLGIQG